VNSNSDAFIPFLRCIDCGGGLREDIAALVCQACRRSYATVGAVVDFTATELGARAREQAAIYDAKEERDELLNPRVTPLLGRWPDLLLTYREHSRQTRALRLQNGAAVLDLGCSTGLFLRSLSTLVSIVPFGIDVSLGSLARAARAMPNGCWLLGQADNIPVVDESMDAVFAFDVLEHVPDMARAIGEVARVLRPGGKALFHLPVLDLQGSFDDVHSRIRPDRHRAEMLGAGHFLKNFRTRADVLTYCEQAGLAVSRARRFNVMFQNIFDYRLKHRFLGRMFNAGRIPWSWYHNVVAPAIELVTVLPDRLIGAAGVGASVYVSTVKATTQQRN